MPNLDLGVRALPWRVSAEDKRWLENPSYNRQYSHEFSGVLFSLFCYFISPSLLSLFKTSKQTKMPISICSVFILGSATAFSFIQPWLIFFLQFLFIFLYLLFPSPYHHHLSLIFGLFKPMSSLPICRTMIPELHHSHRNFQDKSGKKVTKLQRLETVGNRAQSRVSEFNSSLLYPLLPCHVSLAWPTCQNDNSPKERVPASEPMPGQVLSPLKLFLSPGQAQQWTGGKSCTGGKARESGHSVLAQNASS